MNPGDTQDHRALLALAWSLNEGRGMNPGDTPALPPPYRRPRFALNEGRGMNPGDTRKRVV